MSRPASSLGKDVALAAVQTVPAVIVSGGINFAVAYAMYHSQSDINFFPFPNTLAGDLAVTNFIQGVLNYVFPNATLELDSRLGKRVPWRGFMNPPLPLVDRISQLHGRKRRLWDLLVQSEDLLVPSPTRTFPTVASRLLKAILRGLFLSVFLFLITWSIAVAISCPLYCGTKVASRWTPQAMKAIYGGVHALIEIPIASFLIILGIDVRNHRLHPNAKAATQGGHQPLGSQRTSPSATEYGDDRHETGAYQGHIGQVVDSQTSRIVSIDTRTNQPLSPA
ncbi:hypothetical protein EMMF5_005350 [Cystobasidiomycetes sp. EMM_F5]